MIDNGSIEIVVSEDSKGVTFTPDDHFDETSMDGEVERLTGAILETEEANNHEQYGCLGVWSGKDKDGQGARISVWRLDP